MYILTEQKKPCAAKL